MICYGMSYTEMMKDVFLYAVNMGSFYWLMSKAVLVYGTAE